MKLFAQLEVEDPWHRYETLAHVSAVFLSKDGRESTRTFFRDHAGGFPDADRADGLAFYDDFLATGELDDYRYAMASKLGTSEGSTCRGCGRRWASSTSPNCSSMRATTSGPRSNWTPATPSISGSKTRSLRSLARGRRPDGRSNRRRRGEGVTAMRSLATSCAHPGAVPWWTAVLPGRRLASGLRRTARRGVLADYRVPRSTGRQHGRIRLGSVPFPLPFW